ncbi:MAG: penicillin acylase family protein [Planctomycetota bacterium]|nr:MAG: penicillin acylase family protein [Planctomycetota bacterium]
MRRRLPRLVLVLAVLLLAAVVVAALLYLRVRHSGRPQRSGAAQVPGLSAAVEVRWDRWGVPHLLASRSLDLSYAIGWLHANDRLSQMDLVRRAVSGRLSEIFGPRALDADRENRRLRLRQVAETMRSSLSPEAAEWLEAYAAGVNAWIRQRGGDLPPHFRLLRYRPEPWTPADSLSVVAIMCKGLSFVSGHPEEHRYIWLRELGEARARALIGDPQVHIPEDIAQLAAAERGKTRTPQGAAGPRQSNPLILGSEGGQDAGGSNNWVVGVSRSATGAPIVANDPHLGYGLPGVWYAVQMRSPTLEVAGVTLPGLPGVVIGQTAVLAWGLTNNMLDDHDEFFEELDPSGTRVRRGDQWLALEETTELIPVRGSDAVPLRLRSTDRGPLFEADETLGLPARSFTWTAYYRSDPITPYLRLAQARTLEEVPAALEGFVGPAQNLVVGHRDGGLLYTVFGQAPERTQGDGRLPMPGWDSAYGWSGLRARARNPAILRPSDDLLVTANQDTVPPDFPLPHTLDHDGPFRADRIRQMLLARSDWTVADMAAVQTDVEDLYARRILELLQPLGELTADPGLRPPWDALRTWNRRMEVQGASALFVLFERELQRRSFADEEQRLGLPRFPSIFTRNRLEGLLAGSLDESWFDDVNTAAVEDRAAIVRAALQAAWLQGSQRWGDDVAEWSYGAIHPWILDNPMSAAPVCGRWFRRGPVPVPGGSTTVCAFGGDWAGDRLPVAWGPSMRFIADTSNPDRSLFILPAGQSGHPADDHYDDQMQDFLAGRSHPLLWSEAAIADGTVTTLRLTP